MKAVRIHSYGDADQMKLEDIPRPELGPDQVLVRIRDAGVNPVDWKIRAGHLKDWIPATFPLTLGQDFAGEVLEAGRQVSRFSKGDRVFGFAKGAYAEVASVSEKKIAKMPESMSYETAASLPTAGLTAYQIIVKVAQASAGKTFLIHGAAGGVGSFASQIAAWKGVTVIGTASGEDLSYLKSLGVRRAIDYRNEKFEKIASGIDVVVDLIGGETQRRSFAVLKKNGILVTTVGLDDQGLPGKCGVRAVEFTMEQNASDLEELAKLVDQGTVKPRVSQVVPLEQASQAQLQNEKGKSHGKIVLKVA